MKNIIVIFCLLNIATVTYSQTSTVGGTTYFFNINATGIVESLSTSAFDLNTDTWSAYIPQQNPLNTLPPNTEYLFSIGTVGRDWVEVYYLKFRGKIVLIDFHSDEILVYSLNTTRSRLRNGINTLRLDFTPNRLWVTAVEGARKITAFNPYDNEGEGMLVRINPLQPEKIEIVTNKLNPNLIQLLGSKAIPPIGDNSDHATPNIPTFGTVYTDSTTKPKLLLPKTTIRIFPNPAHDKVTVQLAEGMEKATVTIISTLGTTIATDNNTGLQRVINLFGKPSGTYLVRVTTKDGISTTQKLLINNN